MTKQRPHTRTSKKGKRFRAGQGRFVFPKKESDANIHFSILIPSTKNVNQRIPDSEFLERKEEMEKFLSKRFQGATAYQTEGSFIDKSKGLVGEKVAKIEIFTDKGLWAKYSHDVKKKITEIRQRYGQTSIGFTFESPQWPAESIAFKGKQERKKRK